MKANADDTLVDDIAAWHAKLSSGEATDADREAFEAWLNVSPDRRIVFAELKGLLAAVDAGFVDEAAPEALLEFDAPTPTPTPMPATLSGSRRPLAAPRRIPRRSVLAAAAASLAAAVSAGWLLSERASAYQRVSTVVGEQRKVALRDGSEITLNTDTALDYRIADRHRSIRLAQGEAFFEVAKNPDAPFIVAAPQGEIRAVGTAFNVRTLGSRTEVSVTEGVVEVTVETTGGRRTAQLRPGDAATLSQGGLAIARSADIGTVAVAWTRGQLVYQDRPVREVVEDLDRYFADRLVVTGPLADTRISAVINLSDQATVLAALSRQLPIRVTRTAPGTMTISVVDPVERTDEPSRPADLAPAGVVRPAPAS